MAIDMRPTQKEDDDEPISLFLMTQLACDTRSHHRERRQAFNRIVSEVYSPPRVSGYLEKDPQKRHRHATLWDHRSKAAEKYPPALVHAILRGLARYLRRCGRLSGNPREVGGMDAGPHGEEEEADAQNRVWASQYWDSPTRVAYDEVTGFYTYQEVFFEKTEK